MRSDGAASRPSYAGDERLDDGRDVAVRTRRRDRGPSCRACPLRVRAAFIQKSDDEVDFIQSVKVDHRSLPAGAEIIYMGQEDAELFTLFKGWAFRHQTLPDGRRQILNFLLPGDLVGFQASLMTAAQHSVEALTDVEVCVFSRRKAWSIFAKMPEVAYQLAWLAPERKASSTRT